MRQESGDLLDDVGRKGVTAGDHVGEWAQDQDACRPHPRWARGGMARYGQGGWRTGRGRPIAITTPGGTTPVALSVRKR
jgi:hypothetical protein